MAKEYVPHAGKQTEFLSSEVKEVFFGGARGGSKSWSLAYDAAFKYRSMLGDRPRVSIDYPEYRALILRRSYVDIQRNFKPICDSIYSAYEGAYWKERDRSYIFPSGATIILAHCDTYNDVEKYIGGEFHYLGIEEANQFPESWIEKIKGSVRSTNPELKTFIRYTSNPGGIGHLWLKRYFYDKCPPKIDGVLHSDAYNLDYPNLVTGDVYTDELGNSRLYIPALVFDNPSLADNDDGYVRSLMAISDPVLRDMWLFASWDVQVGAFFDCWHPLHHIISGEDWRDKFNKDRYLYRVYRAIDYGTSKPFVCLFCAVDKDGDVIVFDEIYQGNLSVSAQARLINEKMLEWDLDEDDVFMTVVDPAMRSKTAEMDETPVSPVRIYEENGLRNIMYGNNKRVAGWAVMRDYLQIRDNKPPRLVYTDYCDTCVKTIPELVRSKTNLEDIDTLGDDHGADATRYLLMQVYSAFPPVVRESQKGWRDRVRRPPDEDTKKPSLWV